MKKREGGSVLIMVFVAGVVLATLILLMTDHMRRYSHQMVFFNARSEAYRLAETATHEAMGKLTIDPVAYLEPSFSDPVSNGDSVYQVQVCRRSYDDVSDGYFIVANATKTVDGMAFHVELNSYAKISNIGEYFAAVRDELQISHPLDISLGKIYGGQLTFAVDGDGSTVTKVKRAEYLNGCVPDPSAWTASNFADISISEPSTHQPVKLAYPLLFPQVGPSDLQFYRSMAHIDLSNPTAGHHECTFSGDIYPPGYSSNYNPAADHYAGHTSDNHDHVYYCTGTMTLQGIVHGQVGFVAAQDIRVTGDLVSADLTTSADYNGSSLPGAGSNPAVNAASSTAHQAILITPNNVVIDTTAIVAQYDVLNQPPKTLSIQALVMAPNGTIGHIAGVIDPAVANKLSLSFTGSLILASNPDVRDLFNAGANPRSYNYMATLGTYPAPFIPYITDIRYSFEK